MKKILTAFILICSLFLTSCSDPVTYSVDADHEEKMITIYNMISGLVEGDSEKYLSAFEPSYVENVKKAIDTLGASSYSDIFGQGYMGATDFDSTMKTFIEIFQEDSLKGNFGEDVSVALSFESVTDMSTQNLGIFTDLISIGYTFPENVDSAVNVTVKMVVQGSDKTDDILDSFVLIKLSDEKWYIHPQSFLYTFK